MKVKICNEPREVRDELIRLIDACGSLYFASAWVTENTVVNHLLKRRNRPKIKKWVIGTHQYITSADVLETCLQVPNVKVMPPTGPTFHPKVYTFDLGGELAVYVGSSNLTQHGLNRNVECGLFLRAESTNPRLLQFLEYVDAQWEGAKDLTPRFIEVYRANRKRVKDAQKDLDQFIDPPVVNHKKRYKKDIPVMGINWSEFVALVKNDVLGQFHERLDMLGRVRLMFASYPRFEDIPETERRFISGLIPKSNVRGELVVWGLFGEMNTHGLYNTYMRESYKQFSKALDQIPQQGTIRKRHYEAFVDALLKIPEARVTWTGMGTRLLAMKRPDQFVCISTKNRDGICTNAGASPSTTDLSNYWERVIEPIRISPWYQQEIPKGGIEQDIWNTRVAMLDAIYYREKSRK